MNELAVQGGKVMWQAIAHQWGEGKIHLINEPEDGKLFCGPQIKYVPGRKVTATEPTCLRCIQLAELRQRRAEQQTQQEEAHRQWQEDYEQRQAEWHVRYNEYLLSPQWAEKRRLVFRRNGNEICEGCGLRRATQIHHLTYDHVFDEFLWELRAVCDECHHRFHHPDEPMPMRRRTYYSHDPGYRDSEWEYDDEGQGEE